MTKKLVLALLTATGLGAVAQETTQESNLSGSFSQSVATQYNWRGLNVVDDVVNQGDLSLAYSTDLGDFHVGAWYNLDLTDENDDEFNFTEVDIYAGWEKSFDMLTLGAGVINYQFPSINGDAQTTEVYVSAGLDVILAPSVTVYYDLDADPGAVYTSFGVGHDFDLGFSTLSLSGTLGYANSAMAELYYNTDEAGFTDIGVTASLGFDLTESLNLSPYIMYTQLLEDAKDDRVADDDYEVVGGVNLSFSF